MLRFIVRRKQRDDFSQCEWETIETTTDPAALETMLRRGGHGPTGYDYSSLVGVEFLDEAAP